MTNKKRKSASSRPPTNKDTTSGTLSPDALNPLAETSNAGGESSGSLPLPPKVEEGEEEEEDSETWTEPPPTKRPRSRSTKGKPTSTGSQHQPTPSASTTTTTTSAKPISEKKPTPAAMKKLAHEEEKKATLVRNKAAAAAKAKKGKEKEIEEAEFDDEDEDEDADEEGDDSSEGITRCVCGEDTEELSASLMIQCDTCKCWQHGSCVGLWKEQDCPDRYFCEHCRPNWHGPGGILRKAHRKPQSSNSHHAVPRSPSLATSTPQIATATLSSANTSRNKPRESADAALISAFLAGEQSISSSGTSSSEETPIEKVVVEMKAPKKRSTMNSRDAAYDDAIAMSILGPGSAAMRARLEKARSASGEEGGGDGNTTADRSRRSQSKDSVATTAIEASTSVVEEHASKKRRVSEDGSAVVVGSLEVEEVKEEVVEEEHGGKTDDPVVELEKLEATREYGDGEEVGREEQPDNAAKSAESVAVEQESAAGEKGEQKKNEETEQEEQLGEPNTTLITAVLDVEASSIAVKIGDVSVVNGKGTRTDGRMEEDDEEGVSDATKEPTPPPPPPPRAKHPNQYTYRPKNGAPPARPRISPVKRTAPSGLGSSDKDSRSQRPTARDWTPMEPIGWGLPDHLKHLAHLLPTPLPVPLAVPSYPQQAQNSGASSSSGSGSGSAGSETHIEPPTRVRFPSKRMTLPEMKKRARNVLDYLTRIQIDMSDRERRAEALALMGGGVGGGSSGSSSGDATPLNGDSGTAAGTTSESMNMMDSLTKDIILFQQRYFDLN